MTPRGRSTVIKHSLAMTPRGRGTVTGHRLKLTPRERATFTKKLREKSRECHNYKP